MEQDVKEWLKDIRDSVKLGHTEISSKLDTHAQNFQRHLVEDAKAFAALELGQTQIRQELEKAETRRKEESERKLKKINDETLATKAGRYALVAAVLGSLILWLLEHFAKR